MREAAERRQQLELEHEQALAVLNAKQQEIDLLQKVREVRLYNTHCIGGLGFLVCSSFCTWHGSKIILVNSGAILTVQQGPNLSEGLYRSPISIFTHRLQNLRPLSSPCESS